MKCRHFYSNRRQPVFLLNIRKPPDYASITFYILESGKEPCQSL